MTPLYARWLDALLATPLPDEREATCGSCAMCAPAGAATTTEHFNPRTKCCTYLPALPNYLVGRILADTDPAAAEGRATVLARLAGGSAVTPLGLGRTRPHLLLYRAGGADVFGHALSLRCPHYLDREGGQCGIWRHRNATCATWFCKHERGGVGMRYWKAIHRLLTAVESALSTWCVLGLDPGSEALDLLFPQHAGPTPEHPLTAPELDDRIDPDLQPKLWGHYVGKEEAFFRACAERIDRMTWPEVLALSGPDVHVAARLARVAHEEHRTRSLPDVLRLGPFHVERSDPESVRLWTYSAYDPLELPRALVDILHRFDGRPLPDVLETLATGDNLSLEPELIQKLVDFEILQPGV